MINRDGEVISYDLGENILFSKVNYGENFLIFYDNINRLKCYEHILRNFIRQRTGDNSILFYSAHEKNQLEFNFNIHKFSFNVINEDVIHNLKSQLHECFDEMEKTNKDMLLIADWSMAHGRGVDGCEIFIPFLESLIKKSQGLNPPGWKKNYRGIKVKTPFTLVNAFALTNLNDNFIQRILQLHQRVYILEEKRNTFSLPTISSSTEMILPNKFNILPREVLENLVKDNLELIVLLFLEKGDKSGYQVLKDIASHFKCILSQGTLYPLLYQLEKEVKIIKHNGKGREVIYSLPEETEKQLELKKETCLESYQYLASFFEK